MSITWRELVHTLRTSAINYEGYEFDNLFEAIKQHEPNLTIPYESYLDSV
jgi:hypothetical protein